MFRIRKPIRRRNIFLNSSAEGPLGFTVVNGTVTRTDARAHWGKRSWLVTPTSSGCYIEFEADTPTAETHVMTAWCSNGEPSSFKFGTAQAYPQRVEDEGEWHRYEMVCTAAQISGATAGRIYVNRATYIDDIQMEPGRVRSTALNGAMGFGYRFEGGTRHYSVSERFKYRGKKLVYTGGIEYDLDDDERVRLGIAHGAGVPPVRIRKADRESGDGEIHLDKSLEARALRLSISLVEEDPDRIHELRAELIDLLAPKDEIMLITDLGGVQQYIIGAYQSGLELGEIQWSLEKITLNIMCPDSGWVNLGQVLISLGLNSTITATYTTHIHNGEWENMSTGPGAAARRLTKVEDGTVYVGTLASGGFGYVARWTGSAWVAVARVSGNSAIVYDVKRSFDGTKLYICGSFTTIELPDGTGDTSVNNIVIMDIEAETFADLGSAGNGVNGTARKMEWDPTGTYLYVTGEFSQAGGSAAAKIARYAPGTDAWATLGSGLSDTGHALAVYRDGKLLVGGEFQYAGGSAGVVGLGIVDNGSGSLAGTARAYVVVAYNISGVQVARSVITWADPTDAGDVLTWTAHGSAAGGYGIYMLLDVGWRFVSATASGVVTLQVTTLPTMVDTPDEIAAQGTVATPRIALWDPATSTWETVGSYGFDGTVYDLWQDHDGITVFSAGAYKYADFNEVNGIAWWNDSVWRGLGTGPATGSTMYSVRRFEDGTIWAGGNAASFGGDTLAAYVAQWRGSLFSGGWVHTHLSLPSCIVYAIQENEGDVLLGHSGSGSATVGAITEIDWTGNLEGYPKVWAVGPGTLWGFGNFEAGPADVLTIHTLASGEEVVFDLARDAKTVDSTVHGNVAHIVRPGSQMGAVSLVPGDDNTFWFMMTGTDSNSEAKIIGYPEYISIDKAAA